MKYFTFLLAFSLAAFCGCNNGENTNKTTTKTDDASTEKPKDPETNDTKPQLLSGVNITAAGGLKVIRAFVSSVDGEVFSKEVMVGNDQKVILNLNLDGFKEEEGKSFVGAAEKITASDGTVILDEADLFSNYTATGMKADDAKFVRLSAIVTGNISSNPYYTVSFRVWDKKGDGEVTGSYKIMPK